MLTTTSSALRLILLDVARPGSRSSGPGGGRFPTPERTPTLLAGRPGLPGL